MTDSLAPRDVEVNDLWPGLQHHSEYVTPALGDFEKLDPHVDPTVTRGGGLPGTFVGVKFTPEVKLDHDGSGADRVIQRLEEKANSDHALSRRLNALAKEGNRSHPGEE